MKNKTLDYITWITRNFIESEEECIELLSEYEKKTSYTKDKIIETLKIIKSIDKDKVLLLGYLQLIYNLSTTGINASIAGEKLREVIKS